MKENLKRVIARMVSMVGSTSIGRYLYAQIIITAMGRIKTAKHRGVNLVFSVPNAQNKFRVDTFSDKEPETLDWIDEIPLGSVLWDVGANVGLYSCYAAKQRGCRVFAFEPSVFNLELLARNVFMNDLTALVTIVPLPLSESLGISTFNMTTTEWGGALSTFGRSFGFDGKPLSKSFEFSTIGVSMREAAELLRIPEPDYIKMDVDGIEHLILKGGAPQLRNARSVLVEINDAFQEQAEESIRYLAAAGLRLKEKRRWSGSDGSPFESTYNQIWYR